LVEIGRYNTLPVLSIRREGVLLGTEDDHVLLPAREVAEELEVGQILRVFVYTDEGPVATLIEPLTTVGDFAYLEVVDVTEHCAFLDWGLPKDLFVPFGNQYTKMEVGRSYVVGVRVHRRTNRIVAASVLAGMFDDDVSHLAPGDEVDLLVYGRNERGTQVVVNRRHAGLVYHSETYRTLRPGHALKGWVARVRGDHRLDITLQRPGRGAVDDARTVILHALAAAGGHLPLHDKSAPDEIRRILHMSKKVFKEAVGGLYKDRLIELGREGIRRRPPPSDE
jgi:predicted RNA-binding protein (virulence factor B family)